MRFLHTSLNTTVKFSTDRCDEIETGKLKISLAEVIVQITILNILFIWKYYEYGRNKIR